MIQETIETIKKLEKNGFDKSESIGILIIEELKEIKEVLKNGREKSNY